MSRRITKKVANFELIDIKNVTLHQRLPPQPKKSLSACLFSEEKVWELGGGGNGLGSVIITHSSFIA
jgi:hypothetical protein